MKTIAALLLLALTACAPKAIIVEPIAPKVSVARAQVKAATASAEKVTTQVTTTHQQAQGISAMTNNLVAATERIRNLPGVPLSEFDALWTMANDIKREAFAHEIQARETVKAASEQQAQMATADKSMGDLEVDSVKHDAATTALKTQVLNQAGDAAIGRTARIAFWISAAAATLAVILWGVSKFKPSLLP